MTPEQEKQALEADQNLEELIKQANAICLSAVSTTYPSKVAASHVRDIMAKLLVELDHALNVIAAVRGRASGQHGVEVTDEWAEKFCHAVNWHPDGSENKVIEGEWRSVTFRELAKGYIRAALAASPQITTPAAPPSDSVQGWHTGFSDRITTSVGVHQDGYNICAKNGKHVAFAYGKEFADKIISAVNALPEPPGGT